MTKFRCFRCGKEEKFHSDFKRHLEKKKLCEPVYMDITKEQCFKAVNDSDFKDTLFLKEYSKVKNALSNISVVNSSGNNIGNHNTINNTTINLTLSYDNTNYGVIKNEIKKCITADGKIDKEKLLNLTHFNKKYPENQNVMIKNRRQNTILAYNGKEFEELYEGKDGIWMFTKDFLEKILENTNETDEKSQMALDETLNDCENDINKKNEVDKIGMKLYNGRRMVMKNLDVKI